MVKKFTDIFLLDVEIGFFIIYIWTSCQMSSLILNKIKNHLEELMSKKFIQPNVSHWGFPILLIKDG